MKFISGAEKLGEEFGLPSATFVMAHQGFFTASLWEDPCIYGGDRGS